jgi:predicted DNA-binding ArsR family transcriptional regulator
MSQGGHKIMLQIIVNKATNKATVMFDGKEQTLNMVKVNKEGVKPGTYWVNMQPLGTPKKWATVNYNDHAEEVFTIDVDETACRVVKAKISRVITLANIKDFLNDDEAAAFDALYEKAFAEAKRRADEAEANKPVKEKKSRAMTLEEKIAKKMAEIEKLKKVQSGEISEDEIKPRKKKAAAIEDLDSDDVTSAATDDLGI